MFSAAVGGALVAWRAFCSNPSLVASNRVRGRGGGGVERDPFRVSAASNLT